MRKNKLFQKIFASLFIAVSLIALVFSIYFISSQKQQILRSMYNEAISIASSITFVSSEALILDDNSHIVEFNTQFINENKRLLSLLISKLDNTYLEIQKDKWNAATNLSNSLKKYEKKEINYSIIYSNSLKKEVFYFVYPIYFSNVHWGYLHLSMSLEDYHKEINSMYINFFMFLVILFFTAILVSYFIAKSIAYPIIKLNNLTKKISNGELKHRAYYKADDEIGELANSFNKMLETIQTSQEKLKKANDKLEIRVKERTKELENLNKNLDKRVKQEVEKRQKQEHILLQQSRLAAIGEMIGNIAHQWRQPLSAISTAASGIKLQKEFGKITLKEEFENLDGIIKSTKYLSQTIEDFKNFFNPNKEKESFYVKNRLEHALELIKSSFNFYHIKINKQVNNDTLSYGYANELSQAILNILTNAKDILIEKQISNPEVFIRVFEGNKNVILEIQDNAGGIKDDILDKVFEPYFTTKHQSIGTGMGLYMSKMIIEQNMKGSLEVKNNINGACFTIKLPKYKE